MEFYYNCPIHGAIPEENQLISAGGKFCGETVDDTDALCMQPLDMKPLDMKPLETNTDGDLSK